MVIILTVHKMGMYRAILVAMVTTAIEDHVQGLVLNSTVDDLYAGVVSGTDISLKMSPIKMLMTAKIMA